MICKKERRYRKFKKNTGAGVLAAALAVTLLGSMGVVTANADTVVDDSALKGSTVIESDITLENTSEGLQVTFDAVEGSTIYDIHYWFSTYPSQEYVDQLSEVNGDLSEDQDSYTHTIVTSKETQYSGDTYTVYVEAAYVQDQGWYTLSTTESASIVYLAQLDLSISGTSAQPTVSWISVEGAESYQIYRRTEGGDWTTLASTTATSYTDTTADANMVYYYTVQAVAGNYHSSADTTGVWTFPSNKNADSLLVRRGNKFYVNYTLKGGNADMSFTYGRDTDEVLIGDWDGDGIDTICVRRGNRFYFSNTLGGQADFYIDFGRDTDEVVAGDWDGDGCDTLCVRRGKHYYINNTLESGNAAIDFTFGREDDEVLSGDWDGDGYDTLCIRRGTHYYINNTLEGGNAAIDFTFGRTGDSVLSGDWDGDGYDTLCIRRGIHYYINNTLEGGNAAIDFTFGREGDEVYAGTWTADDSDQTEYISVTLVKDETYGTGTVSFAGEDSSVTTKEFKAGDTVSITVTPDEGYSLSTTAIQYADGSYHWPDDFDDVAYDNGTVIEWTDSFTMPEESEDLYITYSFAIDPRLIVW